MKRRSRRLKRKVQRTAAWTIAIAVELILAAAPAALTAAIIVPMVQRVRGYEAIGSEWILVGLVLYYTFSHIHRKTCDLVYGEEERDMAYYRVCPRCGANLDPGEPCDCESRKERKAIKAVVRGGERRERPAGRYAAETRKAVGY